jgi:hypothetical protein
MIDAPIRRSLAARLTSCLPLPESDRGATGRSVITALDDGGPLRARVSPSASSVAAPTTPVGCLREWTKVKARIVRAIRPFISGHGEARGSFGPLRGTSSARLPRIGGRPHAAATVNKVGLRDALGKRAGGGIGRGGWGCHASRARQPTSRRTPRASICISIRPATVRCAWHSMHSKRCGASEVCVIVVRNWRTYK